jgi:chaperone modulatory protein CbpM
LKTAAPENSRFSNHELRRWIELGWLIVEPDSGDISDINLARAHFILDLKQDFGVNDEGVDVILHLIDQMHSLRRTLQGAQKRFGAQLAVTYCNAARGVPPMCRRHLGEPMTIRA